MEKNLSDGKSSLRAWLPVLGLTFATFVFNTSEFAPIGLLTTIADDFHISEAHAGLLITIYAWVVALASLPLMLLAAKSELKKLLLMVMGLFIISHFVSSVASSYGMLMASRIGVACAHAIFWSIVAPMAVRVAPEGHRSVALGFIITGTSIALIIGLPMGRVVGLHVGWRMTFFYIGLAALVILLFLAWIFPKLPSHNVTSPLKEVPSIFKNPALVGVYILTLLLITGHYTGYSYIEPFLAQVGGLSDGWVTFVLTAFGLVGIAGSVLFSRYYDRHPYLFIRVGVIGITALLLLLHVASFNFYTVIAACICWGLCITFFNLVFQSEIIQLAPHATAIAMSIYSGIYNVGIGSGALIGGVVCTHLTIAEVGYIGGAIAVVSSCYCIFRLLPLFKRGHDVQSAA